MYVRIRALLVRSLTRSFVRPFVRSFVRSFVFSIVSGVHSNRDDLSLFVSSSRIFTPKQVVKSDDKEDWRRGPPLVLNGRPPCRSLPFPALPCRAVPPCVAPNTKAMHQANTKPSAKLGPPDSGSVPRAWSPGSSRYPFIPIPRQSRAVQCSATTLRAWRVNFRFRCNNRDATSTSRCTHQNYLE